MSDSSIHPAAINCLKSSSSNGERLRYCEILSLTYSMSDSCIQSAAFKCLKSSCLKVRRLAAVAELQLLLMLVRVVLSVPKGRP